MCTNLAAESLRLAGVRIGNNMAYEEREPTVSEQRIGQCHPHQVFEHNAYGTIAMTVSTGGSQTLFGSDLPHNQRVNISICRARLHRDLNRDWIHSDARPIIEFSMSHAQFAQFITSQGSGGGTPVTINFAPARGTQSEAMPAIRNAETKHDTFRREIEESVRKRLDDMRKRVDDLGTMLDTGKVGMKVLRELHKDLRITIENLPGNMAFVVESAEEALEKATSDAKIDVESYIAMSAKRIGLNSIAELARLENKAK